MAWMFMNVSSGALGGGRGTGRCMRRGVRWSRLVWRGAGGRGGWLGGLMGAWTYLFHFFETKLTWAWRVLSGFDGLEFQRIETIVKC